MERERCCQARNATAARHWACDKAKEPGRVALHRVLSRMLLLTAAMVLVASVLVVLPEDASGSQFIPASFGLIFGFIGLVVVLASPRIRVTDNFDFDKKSLERCAIEF